MDELTLPWNMTYDWLPLTTSTAILVWATNLPPPPRLCSSSSMVSLPPFLSVQYYSGGILYNSSQIISLLCFRPFLMTFHFTWIAYKSLKTHMMLHYTQHLSDPISYSSPSCFWYSSHSCFHTPSSAAWGLCTCSLDICWLASSPLSGLCLNIPFSSRLFLPMLLKIVDFFLSTFLFPLSAPISLPDFLLSAFCTRKQALWGEALVCFVKCHIPRV